MIKAELILDEQDGVIIGVYCENTAVAVYMKHEAAVVTDPNGKQYGVEVSGDWHKYRESLK